jgi:uncharacterized lipoprotein
MTPSSPVIRPLLVGALALAVVSQGGCAWTRDKLGMDANYEESQQARPLEVPPGLDLPNTAGAITVPDVTANPNVSVPTTAAVGVTSFALADSVDSAWRRIGLALGKIEGVTVGDAAKVLNSYEVTYQGVTMLVRAEADGAQTRVTALGPDGRPMNSAASSQLLGLLQARLG